MLSLRWQRGRAGEEGRGKTRSNFKCHDLSRLANNTLPLSITGSVPPSVSEDCLISINFRTISQRTSFENQKANICAKKKIWTDFGSKKVPKKVPSHFGPKIEKKEVPPTTRHVLEAIWSRLGAEATQRIHFPSIWGRFLYDLGNFLNKFAMDVHDFYNLHECSTNNNRYSPQLARMQSY